MGMTSDYIAKTEEVIIFIFYVLLRKDTEHCCLKMS